MTDQIWWYVARSGGIVALVLTGLTVIWGLLLSTKVLEGRPKPRWLLSLHRYLGGLSIVFTGIHIVGLVADSYIRFGWLDVLVPFANAWNPFAVALGVVSMYLLVAVQITSVFMRRIPRPWWKVIHITSYGLFWTGIVHGALAGTDAAQPLYIATIAFMTLAVVFLTGYRILTARRRHRTQPRVAAPPAPEREQAPVVAPAAVG